MKRSKTELFALASILTFTVAATVCADSVMSSTGTVRSPHSTRRTHRHVSRKKVPPPPPVPDNSAPSAEPPGISDGLKGNDAGRPVNMGSPDHVPGTTGTSGQ